MEFLHPHSSPCKGRLPGGLSGGAICSPCLCAPPQPTHQAAAVHPLIRRGDKWASGPILRTLSKASSNLVVSQVVVKPGTDIISCKRIQPTALVLPTPQTELFLPDPYRAELGLPPVWGIFLLRCTTTFHISTVPSSSICGM